MTKEYEELLSKHGFKMRTKSEVLEKRQEMIRILNFMQQEGDLTGTRRVKLKAYQHCLEWVLGEPDKIW